jgi:hypothetical protein
LLFVASDNLIWLLGLIDNNAQPPAYVNTATVSAQVSDLAGNTVGSPVTLANVVGSVTVNLPNGQTITSPNGNYRGQLPFATPLIDGTTYKLTVTAVAVSGAQRTFRGPMTAGYTLE